MITQRDYLFDELNKWRNKMRGLVGNPYSREMDLPEPLEVQRAKACIARDQKIVSAWERKCIRKRKQVEGQIDAIYSRIRERILFLPPVEGLEYIKILK